MDVLKDAISDKWNDIIKFFGKPENLVCVDNTDEVAASRVVVGDDGVDAQPEGTTIIVGKGKTHLTGNSNSLTLSSIVPPQTIT